MLRNMITLLAAIMTLVLASTLHADPVGTGFNFQGRLNATGSPASGSYDLRFKLFDAAAGGNQVGPDVDAEDTTVTGGLFSVRLDFGDVFNGTATWLEILVRPGNSSGEYTQLLPRRELTAAPNSVLAKRVPPNAITSEMIADYVVMAEDLSTGSVTSAAIADGTIRGEDIGWYALGGWNIMPGSIYSGHLAGDSVETSHILNGTIQGEDVGSFTLSGLNIMPASIYSDNLAGDSVETDHILNGTIQGEDVGPFTLTGANIMYESIYADNLGAGSVGTSEIQDGSIQGADVGPFTLTGANIMYESIYSDNLGTGSVGTSEIQDGSIQGEDVGPFTLTGGNIVLGSITHENIMDGHGSALDADTVDGVEASSLLRSDTNATFSGAQLEIAPGSKLVVNSAISGATAKLATATAGAQPDVTNATVVVLDYGAPTAITGLSGGADGQSLTLVARNSNATISDSDTGTFRLSDNWSPSADDTIVLVKVDSCWIETHRSSN